MWPFAPIALVALLGAPVQALRLPGNPIVTPGVERSEGEITHFMTMTFWQHMAAIRGFAGDDVEAAKYYPEDQEFLLEYEPTVVHYEVVGHSAGRST